MSSYSHEIINHTTIIEKIGYLPTIVFVLMAAYILYVYSSEYNSIDIQGLTYL